MSLWSKLPLKPSLESTFDSYSYLYYPMLVGVLTCSVPSHCSAKISQNVNTDEAAVLGAAFYGASLSRQFRTKKIKLQDIATHDIQVSYDAEGKSGTFLYSLLSTFLCSL